MLKDEKVIPGIRIASLADKVKTENADFDTDLHEAIAQFPAPTPEQKNKIIDYYYHDRPKNRGLNLLRSKTYRVSVEELTAMEVGINGEEVQPIRRKGDLFGDYEALF